MKRERFWYIIYLEVPLKNICNGQFKNSFKTIRWQFTFKGVYHSHKYFIHESSMSSSFCIMSTWNLWSSSDCYTLAVGGFLGVLVFSRSRSASETLVVEKEQGRIVWKGLMLEIVRSRWWLAECLYQTKTCFWVSWSLRTRETSHFLWRSFTFVRLEKYPLIFCSVTCQTSRHAALAYHGSPHIFLQLSSLYSY